MSNCQLKKSKSTTAPNRVASKEVKINCGKTTLTPSPSPEFRRIMSAHSHKTLS